MSAYKELIQTLVAAYGRHLPLRNVYFKCFHNRISKNLGKHADGCFPDDGFTAHLAKLTGLVNLKLDLSEVEKKAIVADADKSLQNRFDLLGSGEVELNPIKWSTDFIHGYEWKKGTYYRKYTQVDLSNNADVKVPRELSRCHHLLRLALAYRLTGEEKYARTVIEQIIDWIEENPLMYSINWGCAMDVGIRAVNWIWALSLINGYDANKSDLRRIKQSIYQHGWFIFQNLEGSNLGYNNNHYFSDIVGLLHISLLFKNDNDAGKWQRFAIKSFFRETRLQVLPSGMSYEGSTNYNRLVLELVMTSVVLMKRNGIDVPPDIWYRLENMFDFIMKLAMPDGTMPIVGDQDNGRLLPFGIEDLNDHRYLLSVGAMMFNRGDFKRESMGYNIYSALLAGAKDEFDRVQERDYLKKSELLRDAGFALMRKNENYLLLNVDNQGMYRDSGTGMSHTHCDWFSFVLCAKGVPFIIDPGSYVYSSDADARNLFRFTKMHNTIVVDGKNQVEFNAQLLWDMRRKAIPNLNVWESNEKEDRIDCTHEGYSWLGDKITHNRQICFDKENETWEIQDAITGAENHHVAVYFHLDPQVQASINGKSASIKSNGVELIVEFDSNRDYAVVLEDGKVSKGYGLLADSQILVLRVKGQNELIIKTKIWIRKS